MNNHPVRQLCPFISTFKMSHARLCRPAWSSRGFVLDPTGGGRAMPGGDEPRSYYVGVDVGTGSVRAALVDQRGTLLAFADQPINQWEPQFNHHEQSSEDIWAACCIVSKVWPWLWHSILAYASFPPLLRWVSRVCPSGARDNVRVTLVTGFAFWELRVCGRDQQTAGMWHERCGNKVTGWSWGWAQPRGAQGRQRRTQSCSQRTWLGVTGCEDITDDHSSPLLCLQLCPVLCKVNLHHRGESLPWPYRGSAVNTASFHWGRNRGTERWDNLPMLMQVVRGKAGLEPKQSDSSAAPWVTGLSCLPSGQVRGTSFVWGSSICKGKVGSEKGRKLGKTSASLSCSR